MPPVGRRPRTMIVSNNKLKGTVRIGGDFKVQNHKDTDKEFRRFIGQDWMRLLDWMRKDGHGLWIELHKIGDKIIAPDSKEAFEM